MKKIMIMIVTAAAVITVSAGGNQEAFHKTADFVDMQRFTGDWYVIALMPTSFEKRAVNGIENYSIDGKGIIRVEYTFFKDSPSGKKKVMHQKGWIYNKETNAEWRVQPIWPLKLPYYVLELGSDYSYTVIGTDNYKYLWIMARTPEMDPVLLSEIFGRMKDRGYDTDQILMMEQSWE